MFSHCLQPMQSSILVGVDFRFSSKSKTFLGHTARHSPQPLHHWEFTSTVNFFGKQLTFLRNVHIMRSYYPGPLCHLVRAGTRHIGIYILNIALQNGIYRQVNTILSSYKTTQEGGRSAPPGSGENMELDYGRFNKKLSSFEPAVMQHTDGDPGFLAKYKLRQELS